MRPLLLALAALAASPAPAAERLLATVPEGFVIGDKARSAGPGNVYELVPEGETVEDWSQMITVQALPPMPDVAAWMKGFADTMARACPEGGFDPIAQVEEDGFDIFVAFAGCPVSPRDGRPVFLLVKAAAGQEAMHVVQWAWSGDTPDQAAVDRAGSYLAKTRLCDGSHTAPCPEG